MAVFVTRSTQSWVFRTRSTRWGFLTKGALSWKFKVRIPETPIEGFTGVWILEDGYWNDDGVWIDGSIWKDS